MMHIQTYPCQKGKNTNHDYGHTIVNERYMDFLKFALHRIIETALFYELQAKKCTHSINKLFLYYLAGKKRVQHVILEMIATSTRGKPLSLLNLESLKSHSDLIATEPFVSDSADAIINFAYKRAEKDLNLYMSLVTLEEDAYTKKLLSTLSKLSRDFMEDISSGYAQFATKLTPPQISHVKNMSISKTSPE